MQQAQAIERDSRMDSIDERHLLLVVNDPPVARLCKAIKCAHFFFVCTAKQNMIFM